MTLLPTLVIIHMLFLPKCHYIDGILALTSSYKCQSCHYVIKQMSFLTIRYLLDVNTSNICYYSDVMFVY